MTESQTISFSVEGDPIPAARPRFNGKHAYQPQRNRNYRERVRVAAYSAMKGREKLSGAICAEIKLYRRYKPTARNFGDLDNHLKALFDGMSQIIFDDDAQITLCAVSKFTDKLNPRAEIQIRAENSTAADLVELLPNHKADDSF